MQKTEAEINETLDALGQLQSQWNQCLAPTIEFDVEQFWSMPWSSCRLHNEIHDSMWHRVGPTDYEALDKALSGSLRPGELNFQMGSAVPDGVLLALMYAKPEPTLADAHRVDYEAAACFEIEMATPKESAALNEKMRQAYRRYMSGCQIHPDIKGDCLS